MIPAPSSASSRPLGVRPWRRAVQLVAAIGVALTAACGLTDSTAPATATMVLDLSIPGGRTASVVIPDSAVLTVTGPGISAPIKLSVVFDTSGTATATLTVPIGSNRLLQIDMYKGGLLIFTGTSTFNVGAGTNPPVQLTPVPTTGNVPIIVTIGSFVVSVTPTAATVAVAATKPFAATVRDPQGAIATGITAKWATSNPAIATIDSLTGLVTAVHSGVTTITATALGTAANATVTVP